MFTYSDNLQYFRWYIYIVYIFIDSHKESGLLFQSKLEVIQKMVREHSTRDDSFAMFSTVTSLLLLREMKDQRSETRTRKNWNKTKKNHESTTMLNSVHFLFSKAVHFLTRITYVWCLKRQPNSTSKIICWKQQKGYLFSSLKSTDCFSSVFEFNCLSFLDMCDF